MFFIIRRLRACFGHDKYSAETFDRLTRSMHVKDLRSIANVTAGAAFLAIAMFLGIALYAVTHPAAAAQSAVPAAYVSKLYEALLPFTLSAVFAGLCGIIAWCYRIGSERLGIVDLFACEITTLCRVCTINGLADVCVVAFELDSREHSPPDQDKITKTAEGFGHFDSAEEYTPVFGNNARELRSLSVKVVINITAFYTYWKATRDAFRRVAKTKPAYSDGWHRAMGNLLYMQFLAMESARKAIRDLIEFEPNKAENTIMILLSELPLYGALSKHFEESDVRHARLQLRRSGYLSLVPQVYYHTLEQHAKFNESAVSSNDLEELHRDWSKAHRMLEELKKCYENVFGERTFPARDAIACIPRPNARPRASSKSVEGWVAAPDYGA
jgi:hypothetical protein